MLSGFFVEEDEGEFYGWAVGERDILLTLAGEL
jgi:hypothetical protein